jgi:hypothetical protein
MGIILFPWMGLVGVIQRIPSYFAFLFVLCFALVCAVTRDKKHLKVILALGLVTVILTCYSIVSSQYFTNKPSYNEEAGGNWLMLHAPAAARIFTDFRVSANFTANGYAPIIINDAALPAARVNALLEAIYYNNDSSAAFDALKSLGVTANSGGYLFFSTRFADAYPALSGFDYTFHPASVNYLDKYERSNNTDVIYTNNDITIFKIM